jgi:dTDP-4-amino-4,6-dideoxygalactose transaminase
METQQLKGRQMPQIIRQLFEEEFANRLEVPEAVSVNSGTSALVGALLSLDLNGGEVITTPFTFPSTVNAIVLAGGTPVFVDIDPTSSLIDANLIDAAVTDKTKAILPVHLFGRVCNMQLIMEIASSHNLTVVEDAAQSLGARYENQYAGTIGDIGCFSFYKTKNMSCFEGGMIVGGDSKKIRCLVDPICNSKNGWPEIGHNFRMPEPCCLIGYEKVKLHWDQVLSELGKYSEINGYYPYVIYDFPMYKNLGLSGSCPHAEGKADVCKRF